MRLKLPKPIGLLLTVLALFSNQPESRAETILPYPDYTLIINDSNRVVQLLVSTAEFNLFAGVGYPTFADVQKQTRRLYANFDDQFDFLIFVSDQDTVPAGKYFGLYFESKNDVSGLGYRLFDQSASFGSAGKLQAAIHLTSKNALKGGPSLHELCHRWGGHLARPADGTSHWGLSSVGGQLGGWLYGTLKSLGGNLYQAISPYSRLAFGATANYGNSVPYSELELYLMGLISSEEVTTPIQIAINGVYSNPGASQFTADSIETITISDIVSTQGARLPNKAASQKNFRAMVVILVASALPASRLAQYDTDVKNFSLPGSDGLTSYNFWEATGGRAQMQMDAITPKPPAAPTLTVLKQENNLILSWPSLPAGFVLESSPTLAPAPQWTLATPNPVLINGQNVVTNPVSSGPGFYRLKK